MFKHIHLHVLDISHYCYFLPNKTLIVSFFSSINTADYCLLLRLLLMCALVQVNLNILLDFKEKSFCYFYYFGGGKKAQERFLQKYFQTIHSELLPEILIFFF